MVAVLYLLGMVAILWALWVLADTVVTSITMTKGYNLRPTWWLLKWPHENGARMLRGGRWVHIKIDPITRERIGL